MARYMPKVGTRGLDMMFRTSTVQANLDFADEADMVAKLRVGLALQPTITALFANSPFTDGALNGFLSARSEIWRRHRRGAHRHARFRLRRRAWASSATSTTRSTCRCISSSAATVYHDVAGASFRDLLAGRLAATAGRARDHLRLGQPPVDDLSRGAAEALPRDARRRRRPARAHPRADGVLLRSVLRQRRARRGGRTRARLDRRGSAAPARRRPASGLAARIGGRALVEVAREAVAIARGGLERRARRDAAGRDETLYLAPLERIASEGRTLAERRLEAFHGPWRCAKGPKA